MLRRSGSRRSASRTGTLGACTARWTRPWRPLLFCRRLPGPSRGGSAPPWNSPRRPHRRVAKWRPIDRPDRIGRVGSGLGEFPTDRPLRSCDPTMSNQNVPGFAAFQNRPGAAGSPAPIAEVRGREILDSRGNPTVEVDVILADGTRGRGPAPALTRPSNSATATRRATWAKGSPRPSPTSTAPWPRSSSASTRPTRSASTAP